MKLIKEAAGMWIDHSKDIEPAEFRQARKWGMSEETYRYIVNAIKNFEWDRFSSHSGNPEAIWKSILTSIEHGIVSGKLLAAKRYMESGKVLPIGSFNTSTEWGLAQLLKDFLIAYLLKYEAFYTDGKRLKKAFITFNLDMETWKSLINDIFLNYDLEAKLNAAYAEFMVEWEKSEEAFKKAKELGFWRIVAYDNKYFTPVRRHVSIRNKLPDGKYEVAFEGAEISSWYNIPFFDSKEQAENFVKNISKAKTRRDISTFTYSYTDKPVSRPEIVNLADCTLVDTQCGPAYIHKLNAYFKESMGKATAEAKPLAEDIEKHDSLNPVLWNEDNTLKEEVIKKINEIVDVFVNDLKDSNIELSIKDIIIIGSNANYNYTKDSDIDIHIITEKSSLKCDEKIAEALYGAYRSIFNSKYEINFYDIPVELYVEIEDSPRVSNGIYSVKQEKWLSEPKMVEIPDLDTDKFDAQFKMWEDKYLSIIDDYKNGLLEDESDVIDYINEIYEVRKKGLSKEGEYGIPNLIFKEVRNKGYLDNLKELKNELISKRLSLDESLNWWEL